VAPKVNVNNALVLLQGNAFICLGTTLVGCELERAAHDHFEVRAARFGLRGP
jgi:hypothetical protein